jgi:hypothetical protein
MSFPFVSWIDERLLSQLRPRVNLSNCLIRKVLEMVIIASNKKVLEIIETYRQWPGPRGGKDEANDATAAGGSSQSGSTVSTEREERERLDFGGVGGADRIQSRLRGAYCDNMAND